MLIDYIFIYAVVAIWIMLLINMLLAIYGYKYHKTHKHSQINLNDDDYPLVTILIPCFNESKIINESLKSILNIDYPNYEVILIDDNSNDNTGYILSKYSHSNANMRVISHSSVINRGGKSKALNRAISYSKGVYIYILDADNKPDKNALIHLVNAIEKDDRLGAVFGRYKLYNKDKNILTRFVNIEILCSQINQSGRGKLLNLGTLPGTNFLIRKSILDKVGFDNNALSEDTQLSFDTYKLNYDIKFVPEAVSYQQCPETLLNCWWNQRIRWSRGNLYVISKNLKYIFDNRSIFLDLMYLILTYFIFLSGTIANYIVLFTKILSGTFTFNNIWLWVTAYILFVIQNSIMLFVEKEEKKLSNFLLVCISYFSYSQLWIGVVIRAILINLKNYINNNTEIKWYKTKRF